MPARLLTCCLLLLACLPSWAQWDNKTSQLPGQGQTVTFLPVEQAFQLDPAFSADGTLYLNWQITEGYYLYKHQLAFTLTDGKQQQPLAAEIPPGLAVEDEYFGAVEVYYHQLSIPLSELPEQAVTLAVTSQGCADAGLCYPPQTTYFTVNKLSNSITSNTEPSAPPLPKTSLKQLALMAFFALLGGAILNLMPCVFPVLSLKVLGFAHDHQHKQQLHGLSYGLGVISSFIVVALLLLSLRDAGQAIGWGFQLQSPWFVTLLGYLFFSMGLSLSGVVEFGGNWMNVGSSLTRISGYQGSFFTGVLATVVASPCTAPFMGSALGFAATQPTTSALLIFVSLGLGMALPVILLSCSPRLLQSMPKPGRWMEQFKQILAFPLYATAVWLCWVVGKQTSVNGMAALLSGCVIIALAFWCWNGKWLRRSISLLLIALALSLLNSPLLQQRDNQSSETQIWQTYSADKLNQLQQQGQAVLLNVTADWCITCLANEKLVLNTERTQQALIEHNIVYMKADWTNAEPQITALLAQYGRNGVPLYLFFPANNRGQYQLLPQLLSHKILLDTFTQAKNER